jgi:5-formyltetrahydrofolate cyclo-ligase
VGKIDPTAEKKALRSQFRLLLAEEVHRARPEDHSRRAHRLAEWLRKHPEYTRITTFASLPQEPDLSLLHALLPTHDFYYPLIISPGVVRFHLVSDPETLVVGRYGIREPNAQVHPPMELDTLDVFLCPGLAFGHDGSRLGQGGGFYDRLLAKARPEAPRIGIGFPCQLRDPLPMAPHDAYMSHLDSEEGVVAVS